VNKKGEGKAMNDLVVENKRPPANKALFVCLFVCLVGWLSKSKQSQQDNMGKP